MRISPPRISPEALPAPRPPAGSPGADAFRQTSFLLGGEVEAILAGLNLEGSIASASSGARFRTPAVAGALLWWSQGWLCRLEALHAVQHGNYAVTFPLLERSFACLAACSALLANPETWTDWLADGMAAAPADHGFRVRTGAAPLAPVEGQAAMAQGLAAALAAPDFGAALVLAAGESGPDRLVATFGDRDFHVGLAELALGVLAVAGLEQLALVARESSPFAAAEAATVTATVTALERIQHRKDRCHARPLVDREDGARFAIWNWRRAPGGAPRRLLI